MTYCYINPNGGPLTIEISVNNGSRSNWKCANADKSDDGNWISLDKFDCTTGDNGQCSHQLTTPASDVSGTVLLWRVVACAMVPGVEKSNFKLCVFQDDAEIYKKESNRSLPQCNSNSAIRFRSMLTFKTHTGTVENNDIWDVL